MQAEQKFGKGLNVDISKSLYQSDTYWDMNNMRLVTDTGLSTGNPQNIKGNLLSITIPDTSDTILVQQNIDPDGSTQSITINGITVSFLFNTNWEQNLANSVNNSAGLQALGITAKFKDNRVIIYSLLVNNILVTSTITVIGFSTDISVTNVVPGLQGLRIIGWEVIRQDIYLLTTDTNNLYGQIWKFTYDKLDTTITTIQLVYNQVLGFSIEFPIANPGAIVGNYEGSLIQKLYWTDNNLPPRVLNTADPQIQALDPRLINLQALIKFSIPILQNVIQGGSLKTGLYQYAYRLSMSTGQESVFSQCSSLIPVNSNNETSSTYIKYTGVLSGNTANKSLQLTINNLDTNYENIEVISLYYDSPNASPIIQIIKQEPVPDNGVYTFVHTGTEIGIDITLDEFNIIGTTILRAKSLTSKNNFLFLGGVKESIFDVDFDARAYRFNSSNTSIVNSKLGDTFTVLPNSTDPYPNQFGIPEEFDSINPNQDPNTIGTTGALNNPYIYQYDPTGIGTRVVGGTGPNISYTFVPDTTDLTGSTILNGQSIRRSTQTWLDSQNILSHTVNGVPAPVVQVNRFQNTILYDNYTRVNQGDTFFDFHSPYLEAQLKGYTRGETYRFGIVFFDTNGNQSYVKWIADIEFPHAYMPSLTDPLNPAAKTLRYPITQQYSQNTSADNLGILFNITNVPQGVSGFSIVRSQRTSSDKTVLGQGLFQVAYQTGFCGNVYLVDDGAQIPFIGAAVPFVPTEYKNSSTVANPGGNSFSAVDGRYSTVFIPEHLFRTENFSYSSGDKIELIAKANSIENWFRSCYNNAGANNCNTDFSFTKKYFFTKNYLYNSTPLFDVLNQGNADYNGYFPLRGTLTAPEWFGNVQGIDENQVFDIGGNQTILNLSPPRPDVLGGLSCDTNLLSQGIKSLITTSANYSIFASGGPNRAETDQISGTPDIYICNYRRTPSNAYGGNSFSERSNSEYISTGHYQNCIPNLGSYTFIVYGGDTYINIFDLAPRKKHFSHDAYDVFTTDASPYNRLGGGFPYIDTSPSSSVERYFPVETTINIDLRQTNGNFSYNCGASSTPNVAIPNKTNYDDVTTNLDTIGLASPFPDVQEEFIYNEIYSKENNIRRYFPKSTDFLSDGVYDVRVRNSQKKVNNEQIDSWTQFKAADYLDIDTIEGPITNLIVHQDRLIAFQEKGISVLSVEERVLINDNTSAELTLGTGGVLTRYDYISKIIGSRHQFGFTQSNDSVFFFDMNTKNLYKLKGNSPVSLSVSKGLTSYFGNNLNGLIQTNDNPYLNKGITATYDFKYNEAVYTFLDTLANDTQSSFTISYSDFIDAFVSFYSFHPKIYVSDKQNIFSTESLRDLHLHDVGPYGSFYDTIFPSDLTMLLNPNPLVKKIFDSWVFETEVQDINQVEVANDTFDSIHFYNEHQDAGVRPFPGTNGRKLERFWNLTLLRNRMQYNTSGNPTTVLSVDPSFASRLVGPYLFAQLSYSNLNNNRLVLNSFNSEIRVSPR